MANTKQAKKMIRKIEKRTKYNRMWKSKVKSAIKNLDRLLAEGTPSKTNITSGQKALQKAVDKATKNGVIHKNKANRIKSRQKSKAGSVKKV